MTDGPPDPALLRPLAPPGAGYVTAEVIDVAGALKVLNAPPPPAAPRRAGRGWRCRAPRCPASASTARAWPRSCSCPPAATSPSAPSTRPPPRAGSPSRCRRGAPPASPPRCCRWPCAPAVGRARCCSARSTRRCWTGRSPSCPDGARMTVIETEGLTKRFRHVVAVDGVSLTVPTGARFGLLGPNGSGKTTLVRMLLGLVHPTAGRVDAARQADAARRRARAAAGRGAGGGARGVAAPVGADEPAAARRRGQERPRGTAPTGSRRRSCGSASAGSTAAPCGRTRWGCASASASPPRSCASPSCCSWTSPPTASTPAASARCARCCGTSRRRARRWCCPATC